MKPIVQISDLPGALSVDELMEVRGGLAETNAICGLFGSAVTCSAAGSGFCSVVGSGICTVIGSGITKDPEPFDPKPDPADPSTPGS